MADFLNPKILEALEFAAIAHKDQLRKSQEGIPYISHVAMVGMVLAKAGFDDGIIAAGILHDTVEDTSVTFEDIEARFGPRITELVKGVTEEKDLDWAEKKHAYNEHLKTAGPDVAAISAADLLANRMDQLMDLRQGKNPWVNFSRKPQEYVEKIKKNDNERVRIIKSILKHPLVEELERVQNETLALSNKLTW